MPFKYYFGIDERTIARVWDGNQLLDLVLNKLHLEFWVIITNIIHNVSLETIDSDRDKCMQFELRTSCGIRK